MFDGSGLTARFPFFSEISFKKGLQKNRSCVTLRLRELLCLKRLKVLSLSRCGPAAGRFHVRTETAFGVRTE